jgi:hypothetical protein
VDYERVTVLVDQAILDGHDPVGETVYAELDRVARNETGGEWATGAKKLLTIERLDLWGKDRAREQGSLVNIGGSEAFVSDTRSHRVRVYTEDGVIFAWQHELWWRADWDVLAQMIQLVAAQQDTLGEKLAGMRRGYALRDSHPEACNVEEACARMGVSVEAFLASEPAP